MLWMEFIVLVYSTLVSEKHLSCVYYEFTMFLLINLLCINNVCNVFSVYSHWLVLRNKNKAKADLNGSHIFLYTGPNI